MRAIEFLKHKNIIAQNKSDLMIGFDNDTEESLIELLEEFAEQENAIYKKLLKVAKCPDCDGSGAIPEGNPQDTEWSQCQWCDERTKALEE